MLKKIVIPLVFVIGLAVTGFVVKNESVMLGTMEIAEYDPIVVLELFTSQGCSSCPSADALLKKVKTEGKPNVFTLSYHVDYWNYIGWKDPFSKASYADKQGAYNIKFKNRSNYTPQVVVNGLEHFVGSSSTGMYANIEKYGAIKVANSISLSEIERNGDRVDFNYSVLGPIADKKIKTVLVLEERTTYVKRGENRNRTLINSNIVVAEYIIALDAAKGSMSILVPPTMMPNEKLQLVVLVEDKEHTITGAVKAEIHKKS